MPLHAIDLSIGRFVLSAARHLDDEREQPLDIGFGHALGACEFGNPLHDGVFAISIDGGESTGMFDDPRVARKLDAARQQAHNHLIDLLYLRSQVRQCLAERRRIGRPCAVGRWGAGHRVNSALGIITCTPSVPSTSSVISTSQAVLTSMYASSRDRPFSVTRKSMA